MDYECPIQIHTNILVQNWKLAAAKIWVIISSSLDIHFVIVLGYRYLRFKNKILIAQQSDNKMDKGG